MICGGAGQELTLEQWVQKLPPVHLAHREWTGLQKELAFYHELTVSRDDGVTAIDGGKTAEKLYELWEGREQLCEAARTAEGLLLAYLEDGKFPSGSDCDEVAKLLSAALRPAIHDV